MPRKPSPTTLFRLLRDKCNKSKTPLKVGDKVLTVDSFKKVMRLHVNYQYKGPAFWSEGEFVHTSSKVVKIPGQEYTVTSIENNSIQISLPKTTIKQYSDLESGQKLYSFSDKNSCYYPVYYIPRSSALSRDQIPDKISVDAKDVTVGIKTGELPLADWYPAIRHFKKKGILDHAKVQSRPKSRMARTDSSRKSGRVSQVRRAGNRNRR
jgi:hypothetical protein